jgi:hypothetical protein
MIALMLGDLAAGIMLRIMLFGAHVVRVTLMPAAKLKKSQ